MVIAILEYFMSTLYFPTGISVAQLKKDAKKLSKTSVIKLGKAQDILSAYHARMPWANAINMISNLKAAKFTLFNNQNKKVEFTLPDNKSLTFIHGKPGCGKSTLLNTMVDELLKNNNVTYLTIGKGINQKTKEYFSQKYGNKINIIYYEVDFFTKKISVNLDDIKLNGSILVIDEYARMQHCFSEENNYMMLKNLIDASCHTIISTQILDKLTTIPYVFSSFNDKQVRLIQCAYSYTEGFNLSKFPFLKGKHESMLEAMKGLKLNEFQAEFLVSDINSVKKVRLSKKMAIL